MNIIFVIHIIVFATSLIIPFSSNVKYLKMYSMIIPFVFFHWAINDDTCALTILESSLTGKEQKDTFFGRLMRPIFTIDNKTSDQIVKTTLFVLWMMVQRKLGILPRPKIFS
jgi:hypothetical protein